MTENNTENILFIQIIKKRAGMPEAAEKVSRSA